MDAEERERLTTSYHATRYGVGSKLALHIGEPHPWLDLILENRGLMDYAYLTAENPMSKPLSEEDNARRMFDLETELRASGLTYLRGVAGAGDWQERSVLVLGLARADAVALGRAWQQAAVLCGRAGGRPELVFCDL